MKAYSSIHRIMLVAVGLVFLCATQPTKADEENVRNYVEMMRADLNSAKVDTINRVLKLNEGEAKVFWPIYKQYEVELGGFGDERLALIETFIKAQNDGTLDSQLANGLSDKWFDLQQKRLQLWKKYYSKIASAVSPIRAAQFIQVEHQVSLLVDLNIAAEMPALGGKPSGEAKSNP